MICANREMRTHPQPSMLSTYKNQIVRSAKCEKGNCIQHMSGKSVFAKCEKGKVEIREREFEALLSVYKKISFPLRQRDRLL